MLVEFVIFIVNVEIVLKEQRDDFCFAFAYSKLKSEVFVKNKNGFFFSDDII